MNKTIRFLVLAILLVLGGTAGAQYRMPRDPQQRIELCEQLEEQLAMAVTAADSLQILYNLHDLQNNQGRSLSSAQRVYQFGKSHNRPDVVFDALRHWANAAYNNDSILRIVANLTRQMPPSADRAETLLFIRLVQIDEEAAREPDKPDAELIHSIFERYKEDRPTCTEDSVELLYTLCSYLRKVTKGELLTHYVRELDGVVSRLPAGSGAVQRIFYTRGANRLAASGNFEEAIDMTRRTLPLIDDLEARYREQGRIYRSLDTHRYSCYRRMLSGYEVLSRDEVQMYYDSIQALAERNPRVAYDMQRTKRPQIYYHMAMGHWNEALPLLKDAVDHEENRVYRMSLLSAEIKAAGELGDHETQRLAALELNSLLTDRLAVSFEEHRFALAILTGRYELERENMRLMAEAEAERQIWTRRIYNGLIVAVVVLLVLLIVTLWQKSRAKALAREVNEANVHLRQSRDNLRHTQQELMVAHDQAKAADQVKTDFINNMSHEVRSPLNAIVEYTKLIIDCVPPERAKFLERFANNIEFNVGVILTLINDVLDIAAVENNKIRIEKSPVSLQQMCRMSVDTLFEGGKSSKPGLQIKVNPGNTPDITINTDSTRCAQVIMNLIANAEKFTEKGTVTVDFGYTDEPDKVWISVTDTGPGIPKGAEEMIFTRFKQLDPTARGTGLGLYIVKRMSELLGGSVKVDTSYTGGARFIFTLPVE